MESVSIPNRDSPGRRLVVGNKTALARSKPKQPSGRRNHRYSPIVGNLPNFLLIIFPDSAVPASKKLSYSSRGTKYGIANWQKFPITNWGMGLSEEVALVSPP